MVACRMMVIENAGDRTTRYPVSTCNGRGAGMLL